MKLYFRKLGMGGPIIILHGMFGISDNWMSIARSLAVNNTVVVPDLRNHGRSPHNEVFNFESLTDDILTLFAELEISNPILIGHSLGGKLSMRIALQSPGIISKLVIVDIGPGASKLLPEHIAIMNTLDRISNSAIYNYSQAEKIIMENDLGRLIFPIVLKNLARNKSGQLESRCNIQSIRINAKFLQEAIPPYDPVFIPALAIRGGSSSYMSETDVEAIRNLFPLCNFVTIPGAGHLVHFQKPELFLKAVTDFISNSNQA